MLNCFEDDEDLAYLVLQCSFKLHKSVNVIIQDETPLLDIQRVLSLRNAGAKHELERILHNVHGSFVHLNCQVTYHIYHVNLRLREESLVCFK